VPGKIARRGRNQGVVQLKSHLVVVGGKKIDVDVDEGFEDRELQALGGIYDRYPRGIPAPPISFGAESGQGLVEKGLAGDPPEEHGMRTQE
jgi:hypothetical protein